MISSSGFNFEQIGFGFTLQFGYSFQSQSFKATYFSKIYMILAYKDI